MATLSVLMCTIPCRRPWELLQFFDDPRIEFIYLGDNMKMTIGEKRNWLLRMARHDYVAFVDDDDEVLPEYKNALLEGINTGADVITFQVDYFENGRPQGKPVHYSARFPRDRNYPQRFERLPNHLMCVKRELALATGFGDISFGEDVDYASRLRSRLNAEHALGRVLYRYRYADSISKSRHNTGRRR